MLKKSFELSHNMQKSLRSLPHVIDLYGMLNIYNIRGIFFVYKNVHDLHFWIVDSLEVSIGNDD